jgi:VanZ family protein
MLVRPRPVRSRLPRTLLTPFLWRIIAYSWFAAVVVASLVPESWKARLHVTGSLHLPLHFAVFAFSGLLALCFSASMWNQICRCLAVVTLACILEVMQGLLSGKSIEWIDVVVDIAGILIAMSLMVVAPPRSI